VWSAADVRGTAAAIEPWWALMTADVPPAVIATLRPPALEPSGIQGVEGVEGALVALSRAGRELAAQGYGMAPQQGRVAGVFTGDGVPKSAVDRAAVALGGLDGDRQKTRKHHGRVWQALCLWSAEVIDTLVSEGHPVFPGACGENLLIEGIDWAGVMPGARMHIGTVLAEISLPTIPCKQIRPFFTGAAIRRIDHDRHPGSSRWYASVVSPGRVAVGDTVVVEPRA
jgi:MOSC domain-containing protein YiiM